MSDTYQSISNISVDIYNKSSSKIPVNTEDINKYEEWSVFSDDEFYYVGKGESHQRKSIPIKISKGETLETFKQKHGLGDQRIYSSYSNIFRRRIKKYYVNYPEGFFTLYVETRTSKLLVQEYTFY